MGRPTADQSIRELAGDPSRSRQSRGRRKHRETDPRCPKRGHSPHPLVTTSSVASRSIRVTRRGSGPFKRLRPTAPGADLLDANESTWAFVFVGRVGCILRPQVEEFVLLANTTGRWNYCGRVADALLDARAERGGAGGTRRCFTTLESTPPPPLLRRWRRGRGPHADYLLPERTP